MLVPIVVGLGVVSLLRSRDKKQNQGVMNAERTHLYQSALKSKVLTPAKYEKLADAFEQQGLPAEAILLRKRARLRGMSQAEKESRKAIFRKALASKDPDAIEHVAAIYEAQGATGSAKTLRMVAIGLRSARPVKPVVVAPQPVGDHPTTEGVSNSHKEVDLSHHGEEMGDGISEQNEEAKPTEAELTKLQ